MEALYLVVGGAVFFTAIPVFFAWAVGSARVLRMMRALIYAEDGTTIDTDVSERCFGPDEAGECPRAELGSLVPCAGRKLVPFSPEGKIGSEMAVAPDEVHCPLARVNN